MFELEEIIFNESVVKHVRSTYDDDYIITEPRTIISSTKSNVLMNKLRQQFAIDEILPDNCKYIRKIKNQTLIVIEESPKIRTISLSKDITYEIEKLKKTGKFEEYNLEDYNTNQFEENKQPYQFTLSFPFIVYFIHFNETMNYRDMHLFFRLHPITSLDDYLLKPCLPNINDTYHVCLNYEYNLNLKTISSKVSDIIDTFWFNSFNTDYYHFINLYENVPQVCDFFTWQHNTKIDPLFIFSTEWKSSKFNINSFINSCYGTFHENISTDFYKISNIMESMKLTESKNRFSECDSIAYKDCIISNGEDVEIDNEIFYIYQIKNNVVELESASKRISLPINELYEKIKDKVQTIISLPSIKLDENTILNNNDIIIFNETSRIGKIGDIIQLPDGTINIKINDDFYLLNNFLNKRIQKLDENNLNYNGIQLIKDNFYYILDFDYSLKICSRLIIAKYCGIEKKNTRIYCKFESNNQEILIMLENLSSRFQIIDEDLINEKVFRVNNEIYTNSNENIIVYMSKKYGILFEYLNQNERVNLRLRQTYNKDECRQYFEKICQENNESFTIKSFDKDISYSINDEVITIDWTNKEEMFNIKRITEFCMTDEAFCLKLKDDQENETIYPIVKFYEDVSKNYFATVRKVTRSMNQYKVGMKIKATKRGIPDFPMKDCNEIKAFVIDDIVPLVLLSNFRTLLFESLENFKIFENDSSIDISSPSLPIRPQDCDCFIINDEIYTICNSRFYRFITISKMRTYACVVNQISFSSDQLPYGLLHPRYASSKIFEIQPVIGINNEYGNVIKLERSNVENTYYRTSWSKL